MMHGQPNKKKGNS